MWLHFFKTFKNIQSNMFDMLYILFQILLCYLHVLVRPVQHNSSYFVYIMLLFMCIRSTSLTLNKNHTKSFLVIFFIFTFFTYNIQIMFPWDVHEKQLNIYVITDIPVGFPSYSMSQLDVPGLYCNPPGMDGQQVCVHQHPHHISFCSLM